MAYHDVAKNEKFETCVSEASWTEKKTNLANILPVSNRVSSG